MQGDLFRDEGIAKAAQSAEEKSPGWGERALAMLLQYPHDTFMAEQLREWAHKNGLEEPTHFRAWGSVIITAKKRGLIRHAGYGRVENPNAHRTPASIWRKVNFP